MTAVADRLARGSPPGPVALPAGGSPRGPVALPAGAALRAVRRVRRRRRVRTAAVSLGLLAAIAAIVAASVIVGDFPITLRQLFDTLTGNGTRATDFVILQLRLPRVAIGLLVGGCFGLAGTVFQNLINNPLASPDIIGISYGASAGGVLGILLLQWTGFAVAGSAFAGAILVALLIYGLAWRGGITGYRFVLVGIGISAVMLSVINYLMTRANVYEAQTALIWLTGSLNGASRDQLGPLALAAAVLLPATLAAGRWLVPLQLGDEVAVGIGLRVEVSRLLLIVLGVALAAVATAAAGPVGFVAFVSGPIARRLTGDTGTSLVPAALVGALVVACSDFVAQHAMPMQLPVGVVTAAVGAPYLLFLLVRSNRIGVGG